MADPPLLVAPKTRDRRAGSPHRTWSSGQLIALMQRLPAQGARYLLLPEFPVFRRRIAKAVEWLLEARLEALT